MKLQRKTISLAFILILSCSINSIINFKTDSGYSITKNDLSNIKISGIYTEPFIHITGANWSQTNSTRDWCTGEGTYSKPYIIQDVVLTGYLHTASDFNVSILIESSTNVYFEIKNCTATNAPSGSYDNAGLHLSHVQKGKIYNNNFSENAACGIVIKSSQNNTIIGNNISYNGYEGIHMYDCSNNKIIDNNIIENNDDGIGLGTDNNYNLISDNIINGTDSIGSDSGIDLFSRNNYNKIIGNNISGYIDDGYGIHLEENINHTIIENNIIFNNYKGIQIQPSSNFGGFNNTIVENKIYDIEWQGIEIDEGCNNTIRNNTIYNCGFFGIQIEEANDNIVVYNNISNCDSGIWLYYYSHRNNVSENIISGSHDGNGLSISTGSLNNVIIGNNISNGDAHGISLFSNINNTKIINNTIFKNRYSGISLDFGSSPSHCCNNTILGNTIYNNSWHGIQFKECHGNNISDNRIFNNSKDGINLFKSNFNNISRNNVSENIDYGLELSNSNNSYISWNIFENNVMGCILEDDCVNNILMNNTCISTSYFDIVFQSNITIPRIIGENYTIEGYLRHGGGMAIANAEVSIFWYNESLEWFYGKFNTTNQGYFKKNITIPNTISSLVSLKLNYSYIQYINYSEYIVQDIKIFSNISCDWNVQNNASIGDNIQIKGQIFSKTNNTMEINNRLIRIYYNSSLIDTKFTDIYGNFSLNYTIPIGTGNKIIKIEIVNSIGKNLLNTTYINIIEGNSQNNNDNNDNAVPGFDLSIIFLGFLVLSIIFIRKNKNSQN